jgi:Domain of unknown function (DUF4437)
MTKKMIVISAALLGVGAGSFVAGKATAKGPAKQMELVELKDASWTPLMKDSQLPAVAPIQGDPMKGGYLAYLKLAAGFESPPHKHTSDYWGVLLQGKMTHWAAEGGSEKDSKQLNVGDFTHMPGKLAHISKCYPGTDCIVALMQKGKFDFVTVPATKTASK